jgi:hypothetical protein
MPADRDKSNVVTPTLQEPVEGNSHPSLEAFEAAFPMGAAFEQTRLILDKLGTSERLKLLRGLAGLYGHRVLPGTGAGPQSGPARSIKMGFVPKGPSTPKSQKSAEQIEIQKKIRLINKRIATEGKSLGKRLPDDHALIIERNQLFLDFQGKAGPSAHPQSGQTGGTSSQGAAGSSGQAKGVFNEVEDSTFPLGDAVSEG